MIFFSFFQTTTHPTGKFENTVARLQKILFEVGVGDQITDTVFHLFNDGFHIGESVCWNVFTLCQQRLTFFHDRFLHVLQLMGHHGQQ